MFRVSLSFKDLFQVIVVVEARSVEHAGDMFRILRSKYPVMTVMGVGGAFGIRDRADSGQDSQGSSNQGSGDEDTKSDEDLDEQESKRFLTIAHSVGKRRSKQFSVCEMTLES